MIKTANFPNKALVNLENFQSITNATGSPDVVISYGTADDFTYTAPDTTSARIIVDFLRTFLGDDTGYLDLYAQFEMQITQITPQLANALDTATIKGFRFVDGCTVTVGGEAVTVSFISSNEVQIQLPSPETDSTDVCLRNPDGKDYLLPDAFQWQTIS